MIAIEVLFRGCGDLGDDQPLNPGSDEAPGG